MRVRTTVMLASTLALMAAGAARAAPNDVLPEAPAKAIVVRACTACHQAPQIVTKRRTPDEWGEMIGKMVDRGARLTEAEQDQVYDYLVLNFGPQPSAAVEKKSAQ